MRKNIKNFSRRSRNLSLNCCFSSLSDDKRLAAKSNDDRTSELIDGHFFSQSLKKMNTKTESLVKLNEIQKSTEPKRSSADVTKYNLRCHRNVSEKMTKKDFIYDMRRPPRSFTKSYRVCWQPINRRALNYECNFCHEPIATLHSLSTHVKYHCRRYCIKCYWILEEGETMDKHFEKAHQIALTPETS